MSNLTRRRIRAARDWSDTVGGTIVIILSVGLLASLLFWGWLGGLVA